MLLRFPGTVACEPRRIFGFCFTPPEIPAKAGIPSISGFAGYGGGELSLSALPVVGNGPPRNEKITNPQEGW